MSRSLRYYYDKNLIKKLRNKRYGYKFVCNLKETIGYSANELVSMKNGIPETKEMKTRRRSSKQFTIKAMNKTNAVEKFHSENGKRVLIPIRKITEYLAEFEELKERVAKLEETLIIKN